MKPSRATADLWANANKRTNARNGMGDRADAMHKVLTIKQLIRSIGTNPAALELLAERQHELTPEQRTAVLKAYAPPKEAPKAAKVAKAAPKARSRLAGIPLRGFHSGAQT